MFTKLRSCPCSLYSCLPSCGYCSTRFESSAPTVPFASCTVALLPAYWRSAVGIEIVTAMFPPDKMWSCINSYPQERCNKSCLLGLDNSGEWGTLSPVSLAVTGGKQCQPLV